MPLGSLACMANQIRTYGDPVLQDPRRQPSPTIDGKARRLVDEMFDTLYASDNGLALAAPQIGVQKQVFVWDFDEEPMAIINPEIVESNGEWVYDEGCLSIPGLYVEMVRPKTSSCAASTSTATRSRSEADEMRAGMFQHELDHLNGVLMFDRMTPDQRKAGAGRVRAPAEPPTSRRPEASPACGALTRAVRLVFLARRTWRCRRCGRSPPPASRSCSSSPARQAAGTGEAESPSPVKAAATRARHPGDRTRSTTC